MWPKLRCEILCVCLVGSLASPLRRSKVKRDNSEFPSSVVAQEQQWEQLNEDVLPDHLEGVRVHRDGQFNKV